MREVTTLQNYAHQEGLMTNQCVIFTSKEKVKEILKKVPIELSYEEVIALLVEKGIEVIPVIGLWSDGFNHETFDMEEMKENAPGLHFHNRPIMESDKLEDIVKLGKDRLNNID